MALLIDEVKRFSLGSFCPHVVVADQVAPWLMSKKDSSEWLQLLRAPQRLPFPDTWVEFKVHFQTPQLEGLIDTTIGMYMREINGTEFRQFLSRDDPEYVGPLPVGLSAFSAHYLRVVWSRILRDRGDSGGCFHGYASADHFHITVMYTAQRPDRPIALSISARDRDGVVIGSETDPDGNLNIYQLMAVSSKDTFADAFFTLNSACYLVMVLFHARGMVIERHEPNPGAVAARLKRKRPEPVAYHTISFPGVKFSSKAEEQEYQGIIPAHLVRGHFADYTQGEGLFGRKKILVWRQMHVRGNADVGVVLSEYAAQVPKKGLLAG